MRPRSLLAIAFTAMAVAAKTLEVTGADELALAAATLWRDIVAASRPGHAAQRTDPAMR